MTTFLAFAEQIVAERAKYIRGVPKEANRFRLHVATAPFAALDIAEIRPRHIGEWHIAMQAKRAQDRRGDRPLSKPSIERCHALVSFICGEALRRELTTVNPCVGMKLRMAANDDDTEEKWSYLTLEEQRAILACDSIPEWDKRGMQFAWGTGLRQGEQCNLELRDVHVDGPEPFVYVRFGSPGTSPKSKKARRVPLFGDGLEGARALVEIAKTVPNPRGLLFPSRVGTVRGVGKPLGRGRKIDGKWVDPFHEHLRAVRITRRFRWHDLRHSCFTSLIVGCWGRAWRAEEIQPMAGHSSILITMRYAHLGDDALKAAARATFVANGPEQVRKYGWRSGFFARVLKRMAGAMRKVEEEVSDAVA